MSDDEHQDDGSERLRGIVVTIGAVVWVVTVAAIVARGWGA
ncbi:hypothetical protein [Streptomyces sp. NBC_01565]|nr:hypothetical protein [Streptomyces sp. NBC_01565]MCX4543860.1 hypothetical protein [Streptomyces sp. NBC_01565]